mmetsp:Transcript_106116/g.269469  ORF Transcript_106116/g.269469 Transcript_106116/m.269469 type:complete len:231 (+) Transcript_106116:72-764(+)
MAQFAPARVASSVVSLESPGSRSLRVPAGAAASVETISPRSACSAASRVGCGSGSPVVVPVLASGQRQPAQVAYPPTAYYPAAARGAPAASPGAAAARSARGYDGGAEAAAANAALAAGTPLPVGWEVVQVTQSTPQVRLESDTNFPHHDPTFGCTWRYHFPDNLDEQLLQMNTYKPTPLQQLRHEAYIKNTEEAAMHGRHMGFGFSNHPPPRIRRVHEPPPARVQKVQM